MATVRDRLETGAYCGRDVPPQRSFRIHMCAPTGDVTVHLKAGSIESVIDQVKHRRLATPPGMTSFQVDEDDAANV